jgi:hypothetical protein
MTFLSRRAADERVRGPVLDGQQIIHHRLIRELMQKRRDRIHRSVRNHERPPSSLGLFRILGVSLLVRVQFALHSKGKDLGYEFALDGLVLAGLFASGQVCAPGPRRSGWGCGAC